MNNYLKLAGNLKKAYDISSKLFFIAKAEEYSKLETTNKAKRRKRLSILIPREIRIHRTLLKRIFREQKTSYKLKTT